MAGCLKHLEEGGAEIFGTEFNHFSFIEYGVTEEAIKPLFLKAFRCYENSALNEVNKNLVLDETKILFELNTNEIENGYSDELSVCIILYEEPDIMEVITIAEISVEVIGALREYSVSIGIWNDQTYKLAIELFELYFDEYYMGCGQVGKA